MRTLLKPLSFIPAIILMYMIFTFSSQSGDVSGQLSFKVSCKIIEAADNVLDTNMEQWQVEEWANKINFITRKLAHMAEYFALAIAVSFPLYVYGLHGILLMIVAGIICVGFAIGDEYHQAFVAGRASSMRDVAIDSIGIFFGIILTRIIGWTGRKTIFRPRKPKTKKAKKRKQKYIDEPYYEPQYQPPPQPPYQQRPYQQQPYQQRSNNWPPPSNQPPYSQPPRPESFDQDQQPYYNNQPPYSNAVPQPLSPSQGPKIKKLKKKKVPREKKEKDWFFDI